AVDSRAARARGQRAREDDAQGEKGKKKKKRKRRKKKEKKGRKKYLAPSSPVGRPCAIAALARGSLTCRRRPRPLFLPRKETECLPSTT
ncbi:hypothetical protein B296_00050571, partial [Ensete ventricosum]